MNNRRVTIVIALMLSLMMNGCAPSTSNTSKNDGTYSPSMHLIFQPDFADRSFSSSEDYSLSTEFNGITYIWPEGKGNFRKKSNEISFAGKNIKCSVIKRRLTINGRQIAEFEEGDSVRITGEGRVFVNGEELEPPGNI